MYREVPPSHARAHAETQRPTTRVENPFSRITSPICIPAPTRPPGLQSTTVALERALVRAWNWSPSSRSNGPSTVTVATWSSRLQHSTDIFAAWLVAAANAPISDTTTARDPVRPKYRLALSD